MGLWNRMFRVAESEAHSAIDKLEDPIKMTEQGIRDLRKDLETSMKSLAEVKALAIRRRRELDQNKEKAGSYERKAMLLLQKGAAGDLDSGEADRLAGEALGRKEQSASAALGIAKELEQQDSMVATLEANVQTLRSKINTWENELSTLKARAKVAGATKKLNQQLAQVDSNGTLAMLEKMKSKVDEDEALAQSYGELAASVNTNIDTEIEKALGAGGGSGAAPPNADSLAALKAKMGMS